MPACKFMISFPEEIGFKIEEYQRILGLNRSAVIQMMFSAGSIQLDPVFKVGGRLAKMRANRLENEIAHLRHEEYSLEEMMDYMENEEK